MAPKWLCVALMGFDGLVYPSPMMVFIPQSPSDGFDPSL